MAHHLTLEEREVIAHMRSRGQKPTEIASRLGRADSAISRELQRNRSRNGYWAVAAQKKAERQHVADTLASLGRLSGVDLDAEAERLVQKYALNLAERLSEADPAALRGLLAELVQRVDLQWETTRLPSGRTRSKLAGGVALVNELRFGGNGHDA